VQQALHNLLHNKNHKIAWLAGKSVVKVLASRDGFEPPTCPLGGGCAIHLCHRDRSKRFIIYEIAEGRNRTGMKFPSPVFETGASTNSATPAVEYQRERKYSRVHDQVNHFTPLPAGLRPIPTSPAAKREDRLISIKWF
jgi:hypothetical protein